MPTSAWALWLPSSYERATSERDEPERAKFEGVKRHRLPMSTPQNNIPQQQPSVGEAAQLEHALSDPQSVDGDDEISLLDLVQVVVENLRLLVLGPLLLGLIALGAAFLITPTFTATTRILPPQQQASGAAGLLQSLGSLGGLASAAGGIKNPTDQYIAFLKSQSLQDAVIDRLGLMERYEAKFREDARKSLDGRVQESSGKDGLIVIEAKDRDPAFAAQLANAHVQELGNLMKRLAVTEAQLRRVFFEKQLGTTKENLTRADVALRATGISIDTLKSDPKAAVEGVARLRASITAQEVKLSSMRGYLADTAPDLRQAQNELAALRAQLDKFKADESGVTSNTQGVASTAQGAATGGYVERYREFKYQETLFELFAKQYEIARVDEAREGATIQVVDVATVPERKSSPKRGLIAAVTTLGSFFLLLLFVFVRQSLRNARQDPDTAQKLSRLQGAWSRVKFW